METNNTAKNKQTETGSSDVKVAVNSLQRTLFVERMAVNIAYPTDLIIPYDRDNLYPNKIRSIAQRSGSTMSAIETLSAFISGDGFNGMDTVINEDGQTLWDLNRHISTSKAMFKGFALHFSYNLLGQIARITPMNFETIRWHKDLKHLVYNHDWSKRYMYKKTEIIYNPFNPDTVMDEIKEAGFENYKGQVYYWIPCKHDWYTTCNFDSVLDDAQFEAEAKLYSLSSVQNDYSLSGIIAYPKNIESTEGKEKVQEELRGDSGSANAGGIRVVPNPLIEGFANYKWFHPISRNNIDNLHTNQIERAKFNIYAAFRQPPILDGISKDGMFNEASFADAFNYYNAATETERKEQEQELTKILSYSVWAGIGEIQIEPKKYVTRETKKTAVTETIEEETQATKINESFKNLTGRQLQGIMRTKRKYDKGELTYEQAAQMLQSGFGLDDEQIKVWISNSETELE